MFSMKGLPVGGFMFSVPPSKQMVMATELMVRGSDVVGALRRAATTAVGWAAFWQGLTLVHFSAQREHCLSHVEGCFAGFSETNGSG